MHADEPSAPVQLLDTNYKYGCINFNTSLSWTPPHGNHRIDNYQLRIGGQSYTVANGTSFMINSLPYFENITVIVAIVNCAGVGAESNFPIARGTCIIYST